MSFWRNLKIGAKIYIGFGAMILALIGLYATGIISLRHTRTPRPNWRDTDSESIAIEILDADVATMADLGIEYSAMRMPNRDRRPETQNAAVKQALAGRPEQHHRSEVPAGA